MRTYLKISIVVSGILIISAVLFVFTKVPAPKPTIAPSPTANAPPSSITKNGGDFRFAAFEPDTLDPTDNNQYGGEILGQVYEGLTEWDETHAPQPALAQSWTSTDAQNWTFTLRQDVTFHNGRSLTAQDVVYAWNRIRYARHRGYETVMAPVLDEVTAVSTHTLQITLKQPYAPFPSLLALSFMAVVPPESLDNVNTHPIGTGPFQFEHWTPGKQVVLIANENYYGGRPFLDSITFQFHENEKAMYEAFLAGKLDLSPVPCEYAQAMVDKPNVVMVDQVGLHYYGMKVDRPPFDDVRVRQALNYAVDRQRIVDEVAPCGQTAVSAIPPILRTDAQTIEAYTYNPDKALDLLAQAGWSDTDNNGILDNGTGQELTIDLWYDEGFDHAIVAQLLAEDFRDIGGSGLGAVTAVNSLDWLTYFNNIDRFPVFRLSWYNDFPDLLNTLDPHFQSDKAATLTNYKNEQVDVWLHEAVHTQEPTKRVTICNRIASQVHEDAPFITLYHPMKVYIRDDGISGLIVPSSNWYMGLGAIRMESVQMNVKGDDNG